MRSMHHCRYCWNRNVFKLRRKVALWRSGFRSSSDSEFQVAGAATAKARRPYVFSWNLGATSKLRLAERRCCRSATWSTGMHSSDKMPIGYFCQNIGVVNFICGPQGDRLLNGGEAALRTNRPCSDNNHAKRLVEEIVWSRAPLTSIHVYQGASPSERVAEDHGGRPAGNAICAEDESSDSVRSKLCLPHRYHHHHHHRQYHLKQTLRLRVTWAIQHISFSTGVIPDPKTGGNIPGIFLENIVIVVTDPQTQTHAHKQTNPKTGPITIHCAAKHPKIPNPI